MDKSRRIIIAGGSGLIGRALSEELISAGYAVVVLSRSAAHVRSNNSSVRVVSWDAASARGWEAEVDGACAIVNLAGASIAGGRWTQARKDEILESRRRAGAAIVAAVRGASHRPEVVVQASGVGYYGHRGDEVLDEGAAAGSDWQASVATQWEASSASVSVDGVRHVVARLGVVLSRQGGALPLMALPFSLFAGGPLGNGRQWMSWLQIEDAAKAIRYLIETPRLQGPVNLTAPGAVTNRDFGRALGRAMKRPFWLPVPAFALRLLLGELSVMLLAGQRVHPTKLLQSGYTFRYPDVDAALKALWSEPSRRGR